MTLIPKNITDTKSKDSRKNYILNFLGTSLEDDQIAYFSYCINRLNAFRLAKSYQGNQGPKINRTNIEIEEVNYTEREIKSFIILQNSSLFSPIEYHDLYYKYIANEKELKQVI